MQPQRHQAVPPPAPEVPEPQRPPTAAEKRRAELQAHLEKEKEKIDKHNAKCRSDLKAANAGGGRALGGVAASADPRAAARARAARLERAEKEKRSKRVLDIHRNAEFLTRGGPGHTAATVRDNDESSDDGESHRDPARTDAENAAAARAAWLANMK